MPFTSRPLLSHQQRALAAAAGLVGRPRLAAGLALTLACACGPLTDDNTTASTDGPGTAADSSGATLASTGEVGSSSTSHDDAGHDASGTPTTGSDSDDTLLTEAGTTLATTTLATTTDPGTTGATDTGDATGTGTTGELDDCFINTRTMEVDWDCCEKQNWMPTPQCTPWGPPAPPIAGGRLPAARRARVLA
jgi:hypothetical protein